LRASLRQTVTLGQNFTWQDLTHALSALTFGKYPVFRCIHDLVRLALLCFKVSFWSYKCSAILHQGLL